MRVFETISYNLKQIAFKDTKAFLEDILTRIGVSYSDVSFCFRTFDEKCCDKAIKQFPALKPYKSQHSHSNEYWLSSIIKGNNDMTIHIDPCHQKDLDALLQKIPRPINFDFMSVMLDKVDWYHSGDHIGCFTPDATGDITPRYHYSTYKSNSIRWHKDFDSGNKYNIVDIMVDRTGHNLTLLPRPKALEDMIDLLGKPMTQHLQCVFDQAERRSLASTKESVESAIDTRKYAGLFSDFKTGSPQTPEEIKRQADEELTPIQGVSPKSCFSAIAKQSGYKTVSSRMGQYEFQKVLKNHHKWNVTLLIKPFTSRVDASVSVKGYNFHYCLALAPSTLLHTESELTSYAEKVFEMAAATEKEYGSMLFSLYGESPAWF